MTSESTLSLYLRLARLDKPIGIMLLLWPTLWGLWFASAGRPDWLLLAIFVAGTVLMRSAGCVINDYADRDFDRHVARTKARPLTSGKIGGKAALLYAAGLTLAALLVALPLNRLALLLAIPAAFLAASYPYTKRFLAIPQAYLGVAFGFGIPMAYAAVTGTVPAAAWWLLLANIFWSVAYDTAYAMCDRPDDLKIGIKTSAITFGRFDVPIVMACYFVFLAIMLVVGLDAGRGAFYLAGIGAATLLVLFDQYPRIRHREPQACFRAFLNANRMGAAVFAGVLLDYAFG
ncbi:4-hydroxybenzoate octaprenyltransferase [Jeongeupia chitinilytica]|uniref:4-hydroxybenzoate octaprenyltransferase n=1 Tax=Jeongeupia chitinilytica TaxID=1041641 RepID=A0ABQ3H2P4_9NEIS|nr:4-hydroxybenzoate octaprenyltransferase [Jeongeupia chitinilytica]GHD67235.1 4-hydroxybenzoate octaprenyltransferase [Jeongeupia chitinilytica]